MINDFFIIMAILLFASSFLINNCKKINLMFYLQYERNIYLIKNGMEKDMIKTII